MRALVCVCVCLCVCLFVAKRDAFGRNAAKFVGEIRSYVSLGEVVLVTGVCVCVCVCERERDRERERKKDGGRVCVRVVVDWVCLRHLYPHTLISCRSCRECVCEVCVRIELMDADLTQVVPRVPSPVLEDRDHGVAGEHRVPGVLGALPPERHRAHPQQRVPPQQVRGVHDPPDPRVRARRALVPRARLWVSSVCVRVCVCVYVRVCVIERERECVCVRERERVCVCV